MKINDRCNLVKHTTNVWKDNNQKRFDWLIDRMHDYTKTDNRMIIVIDGDNASGKSSASLSIGYYFYKKLGYEFTPADVVGFSAFEALQMQQRNLNRELAPGTTIILEEAEASLANRSVGAVQEFVKNIQINRSWLMHGIINLPDRSDISHIYFKVAHVLIWCKGANNNTKIIKAQIRARYRDESDTAFVNPDLLKFNHQQRCFDKKKEVKKWQLNKKQGAWIDIPYIPEDVYAEYSALKKDWFEKRVMPASQDRIARLSNTTSGLTENITRFKMEDIFGSIGKNKNKKDDEKQELDLDELDDGDTWLP